MPPISNQVADYLIDWVKKNGLKPGDKIPPELELVQILNTGRSSVRESYCHFEEPQYC